MSPSARRRAGAPALALLFAALLTAACGKKDEPNYGDQVGRALREGQASGARGDLTSIANAVTLYLTNEGNLPAASGIDELATKLEPGYVKRVPRVDPWGTQYTYWTDGTDYKLGSAGVDKTFGTPDDMEMVNGQVTKMPKSYERFN